jgi:HK97 family phage major capsid protein
LFGQLRRWHVKGTRMKSHELRQKAAELREKILATVNKAETENREVNADEVGLIDGWKADADSLERRAKIVEDAEASVAESRKSAGRVSAPIAANEGEDAHHGVPFTSLEARESEADKRRSFGEFLQDITAVTDRNTPREAYETSQNRLANLYKSRYRDYATHGGKETRALNSTSGVSGGYLIPTDFQAQIRRYSTENAIVRPRATIVPMNGLEIEIPQLDASTVPTGGTAAYGGIKMDWTAEQSDKPESEPVFKQTKLVAHELAGYCAVSRVTLQKSPASIDSLLFDLFGKSVAREEDRAFFRGNVAGKPFGIHFHPSLVSTSARGSSSAITFANATAVWTRVHPDYRGNGVWVASQAAESAVLTMTGTANSVFFPTGVYNASATGTANAGPSGVMLYMRPVLISTLLPALNTAGDFGFYDFSQYLIGDPGIMEIATSEHFLFRKNQVAFRLVEYVGGMPWPLTPLTLDDGSTTVSPFVSLAVQ